MIVGTGVDIIEVSRVEEAIGRFGDRFLSRIFTEAEIRYCNSNRNQVERFAARFAAKEAAMKALGTGLRRGVSWQHIEVGHQPGGRPTISFSHAAAEIAAELGARRVSLSVSHTEQHAIAQVILED
jgi:holo-[acyl-carrier protein] synthase